MSRHTVSVDSSPPFEGLEDVALPADAVELGAVLGAWGVKGWLKIRPFSADAQALLAARSWFIQFAEKSYKKTFNSTFRLSIRQARPHSDAIVAWVEGIQDRDTADALRGATVLVSRADFPTLSEGEYYWVDLLGLDVVNREGVPLGKVENLLATGPQTTLVLKFSEAERVKERLIPFVAAYVDAVDLGQRRIMVDWQPDF